MIRKLSLVIFILSPWIILSCSSENLYHVSNDGYLPGADGAYLYYQVKGSGADTIVVIHGGPGAGMNSVMPYVDPLKKYFTLIYFDQRGGGKSTLPTDTSKLQPYHFTEDLEAVRKYFGIGKMNLLAHSFGSILTAEYAQSYSDKINKIVLHGATGPFREEMANYYRIKSKLAPPSPDTVLSKRANELLQKLLQGESDDPKIDCKKYELISLNLAKKRGESIKNLGTTCNASKEAIQYYYQYTAQAAPNNYGNWDYRDNLNHVYAPVLIVYGDADSLAIPFQESWSKSFPNSRLLLIPGASKGTLAEKPDAAIPAIRTFFSGTWPENMNNPG